MGFTLPKNFAFRIVRILFFLGVVGVFVYLTEQRFAFDGRLVAHHRFDHESGQIIQEFSPSSRIFSPERNIKTSVEYRRWQKEPLYFEVHMPRLFQQVTVQMTYRNPTQPIVELGLRNYSFDWGFDWKTLENRLIENTSWQRKDDSQQKLSLLQKFPTFSSVQDFLDHPPSNQRVAVYRASFPQQAQQFFDYQPTHERQTFTTVLRGSHVFYTYIQDEPLFLHFVTQDLNQAGGPYPVSVGIYRNGQLVKQVEQPDDGVVLFDQMPSAPRSFEIFIPDLSKGIYKIVFNAGDNILIREMTTAQRYFVVENSIYPAGNEPFKILIPDLSFEPTTLFTNAAFLQFLPQSTFAFQLVKVGEETVTLSDVSGRNVVWRPFDRQYDQIRTLFIPKNQVKIVGQGFFSFSPDSFFDPSGNVYILHPYLYADQMDFILFGDYEAPKRQGNWTTVRATWPIRKEHLRDDTVLNFILSAPGLNDAEGDILLRDISVILEKEPLSWKTLVARFKRLLQ